MSDPIEAMADEMIYHRTRVGGFCSCGHAFRPGASIMLHRATAAYTAMTLDQLGMPVDKIHEAVLTTMKLVQSKV